MLSAAAERVEASGHGNRRESAPTHHSEEPDPGGQRSSSSGAKKGDGVGAQTEPPKVVRQPGLTAAAGRSSALRRCLCGGFCKNGRRTHDSRDGCQEPIGADLCDYCDLCRCVVRIGPGSHADVDHMMVGSHSGDWAWDSDPEEGEIVGRCRRARRRGLFCRRHEWQNLHEQPLWRIVRRLGRSGMLANMIPEDVRAYDEAVEQLPLAISKASRQVFQLLAAWMKEPLAIGSLLRHWPKGRRPNGRALLECLQRVAIETSGKYDRELGKSINMAGSRAVGLNPCFKQIGVVVHSDPPDSSSTSDQSCPTNIRKRKAAGEAPAPKLNSRKTPGGPVASDAPQNSTSGIFQFGADQNVYVKMGDASKCASILESVMKAAERNPVGANDLRVRTTQWKTFLEDLPNELHIATEGYSGLHIVRKALLFAAKKNETAAPESWEAVRVSSPDEGKYLTNIPAALRPSVLSAIIGVPADWMSCWLCLAHEAIIKNTKTKGGKSPTPTPPSANAPLNADVVRLLLLSPIQQLKDQLGAYKQQHGHAPSIRVLAAALPAPAVAAAAKHEDDEDKAVAKT